jgi:hypothetical protein
LQRPSATPEPRSRGARRRAARSAAGRELAERADQAIQVGAAVFLGDGDQQPVAELGGDAAEVETGDDILGFERLANAGGATAAHAHAKFVEGGGAREARGVAGKRDDALVGVLRLGEAALGDRHEAALAEQRSADREREREQALIRADVAGRALAPNVLLARRERQHVAALAARIDRLAADAPGQLL